MIVTPDDHLKHQMLAILADEHKLAGEREGTHVSDLIYCLTKKYWDQQQPSPPSETEIGLWSIGWSLERVMISRLHVEPITVDGVTMSLDFALPDGTIADIKTTRMAPNGRKGSDGFEMPEGWIRQFKSYRHGYNLATRATSHDFGVVVVHLIQAEVKAYRIQFSSEELLDNWHWLLERRNSLARLTKTNNPEPYQHNEEWECKTCSRSLSCGLYASIHGGQS